MTLRRCTCGAASEVRRELRREADGREETYFRVKCPVCGQTGPAVALAGRDEATAVAAAIEAWNAMIARLRPLGD